MGSRGGQAGRCRLPNLSTPLRRGGSWPGRTGLASVAVRRRRRGGSGVGGRVGLVVGPDEPGQPVRAEHGGGHPFDVGVSIPAASRASRTTSARSALCSARVLPDQSRETRTRRPPQPRFSRSWAFEGSGRGEAGSGLVGLDAVAEPVRGPTDSER